MPESEGFGQDSTRGNTTSELQGPYINPTTKKNVALP